MSIKYLLFIFTVSSFYMPVWASPGNPNEKVFEDAVVREGREIFLPFEEWVPSPFKFLLVKGRKIILLPEGLSSLQMDFGRSIHVYGVGSGQLDNRRLDRRDIPLQPKKECLNELAAVGYVNEKEASPKEEGNYLNIPLVKAGKVLEMEGTFIKPVKQASFARGTVRFSIRLPKWQVKDDKLSISLSAQNDDSTWTRLAEFSAAPLPPGTPQIWEVKIKEIVDQARIKFEFHAPVGSAVRLYEARLFGVGERVL